jgi:hypothetical protein
VHNQQQIAGRRREKVILPFNNKGNRGAEQRCGLTARQRASQKGRAMSIIIALTIVITASMLMGHGIARIAHALHR